MAFAHVIAPTTMMVPAASGFCVAAAIEPFPDHSRTCQVQPGRIEEYYMVQPEPGRSKLLRAAGVFQTGLYGHDVAVSTWLLDVEEDFIRHHASSGQRKGAIPDRGKGGGGSFRMIV